MKSQLVPTKRCL